MKKQWLSIVLVLCMVLCLTPTTARAAEGEKTCTLTINVEVEGLPKGVSAEGKTFTFGVKKATSGKPPRYYVYDTTTVIVGADGKGTRTVSVAPGKYIVQQTECSQQIGAYIWQKVTYTPSGNNESGEQEMTHDDKSITFTARNTYIPASETNVTTLPITVTGYKAGANVKDARVTTTQPGIDLSYFRFMEKNSDGTWRPALLTETFKENTDYKVEAYFKKIPGCDYTGLTGDSVTVNGVKADAFETTWDDSPKNEDYRVVHGLGQPEVVKTVKSIEITTPPTKTTYMAGDKFEPTGMVVTAHYTDGTTDDLPRDKYAIFCGNNDDKLTQGQTYVTIQYIDGSGNSGIKAYQKITVGAYEGPHTHTYAGSPWYSDENSHWHQCTDTGCPDRYGSTKDLESHTFVWMVDQAATTTQTGLKHEECTVCRFKRNENTVIPVLTGTGVTTYPITVMSGKNGGVTASHKTASKGALVTLTVAPDKGYVLETLNVLDQNGSALPLTRQNGKYSFTMPASAVTVKATFMDDNTMLNFFVDVSASDYYYDAVLWAVEKGITSGTSATTFDPSGICTRAQAVTFLWRAAGSPAAKSSAMPFADVKAGSYYETAVLWAVEQGITKGTSDTMFSPDATCTRAQIVTFLWRANGSPAVSGSSAFTDVASDAYYAAAVTWAEKNGVTGGIGGGLFGSDNNCTRAQIVTFLYRSVK